ncbi:MAG: Na+/H+ antiporter NhaA [Nocardioidaceae bacterium]|nr:Na+/H+ antiporter NhaA [Nocardioidaceae bacterium]
MPKAHGSNPAVFSRGSWVETSRIAHILRKETLGGALLLVAAVLALIWANSPWSHTYESLRQFQFGAAWLHLDLTVSEWAGDGLLAIFFFVAGLELKREFVAGDLRDPRRAAVPVAAAVGGVVVPAAVYLLVNLGTAGAAKGWAIPAATDIAFALAVLAVIGAHLPAALRTFLLTLAVVDDLLAITIIAAFYTTDLAIGTLLLAALPLGAFAALVQRRIRSWWLLVPLALLTWGLVHASGVHATVAGVLLAFTVPVIRSRRAGGPDAGQGLAEHLERAWRPLSAAVAVPVFAFVSAGVTIGGLSGLAASLTDSVAIGVVAALVVGKALGVFGATYLTARFTRAHLDTDLAWIDVAGLAILSGIGFTVSLLIGELAFGESSTNDSVKVAVLTGSLLAALLAAVVLRLRNRIYRRICQEEAADADRNAIPDAWETPQRSGG